MRVPRQNVIATVALASILLAVAGSLFVLRQDDALLFLATACCSAGIVLLYDAWVRWRRGRC